MSDEYLTIVWREPVGEDVQRLLEAGGWTFSSRSHVGKERDDLRAENERLLAELGVVRSHLLGQRVADGVAEGATFPAALSAAMYTADLLRRVSNE